MRRGLLLGSIALGATLVTGCTRSPEADAKEAKAAIASWEATRRLLDEQRGRGVLPGPYVRQVTRAIEEGRAQALAQLHEASSR